MKGQVPVSKFSLTPFYPNLLALPHLRDQWCIRCSALQVSVAGEMDAKRHLHLFTDLSIKSLFEKKIPI